MFSDFTHDCDEDVTTAPDHPIWRDAAAVGSLVVTRDAGQQQWPVFVDKLPLVDRQILTWNFVKLARLLNMILLS